MTEQRAIKIALVTTFYPPFSFGGDGIYVRRMAHALARMGCDVHIIHDADAYRTLAPKGGDLIPIGRTCGRYCAPDGKLTWRAIACVDPAIWTTDRQWQKAESAFE